MLSTRGALIKMRRARGLTAVPEYERDGHHFASCIIKETMALLWNPESWSQRLAELEARSGELKEAPLRRDVRSLGTLLGEVLREQAGEDLFAHVEALRQGTIRRRDAEARGNEEEAARQAAKALELVHSLPAERAILLTRAFAFYFELINLAETNHRKRRRIALQLSGETGRQRGFAGRNAVRDAACGHRRRRGDGLAAAHPDCAGLYGAPNRGGAAFGDVQAAADRGVSRDARSDSDAGAGSWRGLKNRSAQRSRACGRRTRCARAVRRFTTK